MDGDTIFPRTVTHPYGYFATGNLDLGFVRISKCGSNSFANSFGLHEWTKYEHASEFTLFCALREPWQRFLSSIPETLLRCGGVGSEADVPIDIRIFDELQRLAKTCWGSTDLNGFVSGYLDIIHTYGFFDAHHEPFRKFLWDFEPEIENINFFRTEDMTTVISALQSKYHGHPVRENSRSTGTGSNHRAPLLLGERLASLGNRIVNCLGRKSTRKHDVARAQGIITNDEALEFYRRLQLTEYSHLVSEMHRETYRSDIELYRELMSALRSRGSSGQRYWVRGRFAGIA